MSTKKQEQQSSTAGIFWDLQNIFPQDPLQIAHSLLFAKTYGAISTPKVYAQWKRVNSQLEQSFHELEFDCIHVPDGKNKVDKKLIADCLKVTLKDTSIKTIFLVTADEDFCDLICQLQKRGIKLIVIGKRIKESSRKLCELADEYYSLQQISQVVDRFTCKAA